MPIVNYVREHIRFMEYASDEHLSSSERLVWYALMHIMNQRAQGNIWPDEFIRISNDRLLSFCPMKMDTMAAARNRLKQRGLIDFLNGEKNKKSPAYRMIYFYPQYVQPDTERDGMQSVPGDRQERNPEKLDCAYGKSGIERDNPRSNTEKSYYIGGNMGDNFGGNMGDKPGDNPGGNMGDIYNKHIRIQERIQEQETETVSIVPQRDFSNQSDMRNLLPLHPPLPEYTGTGNFVDEEEDEVESDCGNPNSRNLNCSGDRSQPSRCADDEEAEKGRRLRNRARLTAETAWQEYIGTRPTAALIERLADRCMGNGFDPGVLEMAIEEAGNSGANNPAAYVNAVLNDWFDQGLKTRNDVFYYMGYRNEINGNWDTIGPVEAQRRLGEFLEKVQERNARGGRENVI